MEPLIFIGANYAAGIPTILTAPRYCHTVTSGSSYFYLYVAVVAWSPFFNSIELSNLDPGVNATRGKNIVQLKR
ncbi:MAG: hypothetical protein F4X44_12430 [Gammaproteobacteria bacterium]|nr:hypothetical protein [Gammaproteobacteria bacterium]